MRLLERYSWPGNVRELEHTIERAVALERTNSIEPERLPEKISNYNPYRVAEAMEFPDEGINLTAHLTNSKRRMCSRRFAARQVIRRMPLSCSGCLFVHCVTGQTRRPRPDRTDARRASWSRLAPAPPLLRSSRGAVKKTRANSPPAPAN